MVEYLTFCVALLVFFTAVVNYFAGKKRDEKIMQLTVNVDGRLTELLALTAKSAHAEGKIDGAAEEKAQQ